jgi:predicted DNA repair protein MutK
MVGGAYLCYEGAEKLWETISPHAAHEEETAAGADAGPHEDELVSGAIRTDFILSAEIMVISLNEVADEPFLSRALILVVVALAITAGVYGAVGLIVKMDDVGLRLAQTREGAAASLGRGLVRAMPIVMAVLSTLGIAAMLWVGGHILLVGLDEIGLSAPYDEVHHLEEDVDDALGAAGGVGAWLTNTTASAILGLVVGAIVVAVMHLRQQEHRH